MTENANQTHKQLQTLHKGSKSLDAVSLDVDKVLKTANKKDAAYAELVIQFESYNTRAGSRNSNSEPSKNPPATITPAKAPTAQQKELQQLQKERPPPTTA